MATTKTAQSDPQPPAGEPPQRKRDGRLEVRVFGILGLVLFVLSIPVMNFLFEKLVEKPLSLHTAFPCRVRDCDLHLASCRPGLVGQATVLCLRMNFTMETDKHTYQAHIDYYDELAGSPCQPPQRTCYSFCNNPQVLMLSLPRMHGLLQFVFGLGLLGLDLVFVCLIAGVSRRSFSIRPAARQKDYTVVTFCISATQIESDAKYLTLSPLHRTMENLMTPAAKTPEAKTTGAPLDEKEVAKMLRRQRTDLCERSAWIITAAVFVLFLPLLYRGTCMLTDKPLSNLWTFSCTVHSCDVHMATCYYYGVPIACVRVNYTMEATAQYRGGRSYSTHTDFYDELRGSPCSPSSRLCYAFGGSPDVFTLERPRMHWVMAIAVCLGVVFLGFLVAFCIGFVAAILITNIN